MRDAISGRVFQHHQRMKESFVKSRIVRGGSAKIERTIREEGWDPLNPVVTVAVYVNEAGVINNSKIVLSGTLEGFTVDAQQFFPDAPVGAEMKFSNMNLNGLRFASSLLSSLFIHSW